eukprot:4660824-Lingulodinium_polyedra.AAC.1
MLQQLFSNRFPIVPQALVRLVQAFVSCVQRFPSMQARFQTASKLRFGTLASCVRNRCEHKSACETHLQCERAVHAH